MSNRPTSDPRPDRRAKPPAPSAPPLVTPPSARRKPRGRHSAIGDQLGTLQSYKEWVNRIRSKWDAEK